MQHFQLVHAPLCCASVWLVGIYVQFRTRTKLRLLNFSPPKILHLSSMLPW